MVVVIGAIFVSTHGTTAPRTMAAATDKAVTPISMARKRWDTTTPLAWSNKNKNKNKNKINNSGGNVTASMPADSYARAATAAAFA
jgi:hypothetical protein